MLYLWSIFKGLWKEVNRPLPGSVKEQLEQRLRRISQQSGRTAVKQQKEENVAVLSFMTSLLQELSETSRKDEYAVTLEVLKRTSRVSVDSRLLDSSKPGSSPTDRWRTLFFV